MNGINDEGHPVPRVPSPGGRGDPGSVLGNAERPHRRRVDADGKVPVLLVEDSPFISRSLVDLIEEDGRCRVVHTAETEEDAIARLASGACTIAVVDLQLKRGSGLGVLAYLRDRPERPLTIVLTNFARPEIQAECHTLGAHHFFDKSREFDRVMPAIERYLDGQPDAE